MRHLTPEQIVAHRDGELRDAGAARHLAACPICRAKAARARRLGDLLRRSLAAEPPAHPPAETLAAYLDNALSAAEMAEVAAHVGQCHRCAAELALVREATGHFPV